MNADAIEAINALDVDCTIIKGDIADRGLPEAPHHGLAFDAGMRHILAATAQSHPGHIGPRPSTNR